MAEMPPVTVTANVHVRGGIVFTVTPDQIEHRFTNHPPVTPHATASLDAVTAMCISMGNFIVETVPAGREQALALTQLEQLSMWAKAGIARNQLDGGTDGE